MDINLLYYDFFFGGRGEGALCFILQKSIWATLKTAMQNCNGKRKKQKYDSHGENLRLIEDLKLKKNAKIFNIRYGWVAAF